MSDEAQARALLDGYARQAPTHDFGTDLWDQGRARRRKGRYAGVGVVVAATALAVLAFVALDSNIATRTMPAGPPNPEHGVVTTEIMQEPWRPVHADGLAWLPSPLPHLINPDWNSAPLLSTNPVDRAVAALERDVGSAPQISVLGDDGVWRRLDVGDVENVCYHCGRALQPNSIAPDQRRLAIPQQGAVVIIDLKEATAQRFAVPGTNERVAWAPDGQTVLVGNEDHPDWGVLLDVSDGTTVRVPFNSDDTTFRPDGSAVGISTVPHTDVSKHSDLRTYVNNTETQSIPLYFGADSAPVATEQSLAIVRGYLSDHSNALLNEEGPLVVDIETGNPIAMLPLGGWQSLETIGPLGWLDQDTAIFKIGDDVVAWTYTTGELQRVTEVPFETEGGQDPTLALSMAALQ